MMMEFEFTVVALSKRLKELVMLLRSPIRGVAPLLNAIRKLQSSAEHFTVLHPDFLLLCLSAKCYKSSLSILQDDIYEVDRLKDLLLYGYYGWVLQSKEFIAQLMNSYLLALVNVRFNMLAGKGWFNSNCLEIQKRYLIIAWVNSVGLFIYTCACRFVL